MARLFRTFLATLSLGLLAPLSQAAVWDASVLSQAPPDSSVLSFSADGIELSFTQDDVSQGSMQGSDLVGYEGLWLGGDQAGYHYLVQLSAPVTQVSISFLALSNVVGSGVESLGSWVVPAGVSIGFASPDASASWNGSTVTPLDEDSRGVLSFTALAGTSFSGLSFVHTQAVALNGFIIDRVEAIAATPVPEAPSLALLLFGLALLGGAKWVRAARPGTRL